MTAARICPVGDLALNVEFADEISPAVNAQIRAFTGALARAALPGVVEIVPTYRSVTVHYRPEVMLYGELSARLNAFLDDLSAEDAAPAEVIELPVRYGGDMGPDLPFVARHCGLSPAEVIRIHSAAEYLVYMLGFTPGFPYLGGMDERIATPRLEKPRTRIPAGSVGIAGTQTGAYPLDTPGGWQLIGRTPVKLYDPEREQPILLRAGQFVKFTPIDDKAYAEIAAAVQSGAYRCTVSRRSVR